MSHILKFLEPEAAKAIIDSALTRLRPGGRIVVLDMNISTATSQKIRSELNRIGRVEENGEMNLHDLLYGRIQKAFNYLEQLGTTDRFKFSRYALGLALPEKIARKINNQSLTPDEMDSVVPQEGCLVKHPVTDATADEVHRIGNKTLFPMFVECMIELEKIDPDKERNIRKEENQRQREERKRKKQQRKRR